MIKQRVIILAILFFAMAVMLEITSRTHHHHFDQVCFVSSHWDKEYSRNHHGSRGDACNHTPDHPVDDQCKINSVYVTPPYQKIPGIAFLKGSQKSRSFFMVLEEEVPEKYIRYSAKNTILKLLSAGGSLKMLVRAVRAPPYYL